jgi:uncharacterized LabA/DUF88 family protein
LWPLIYLVVKKRSLNLIVIINMVAVLIDGNNMYHSVKAMNADPNAILNYDSIVLKVLDGRSLSKFIFFKEGVTQSDKFAKRVKKLFNGSVVSTGPSSDMFIALEMVKSCIFQKVDTIILFSGDGDYCPAVDFCKQLGCRIEVVSAKNSLSPLLKNSVHKVTLLELEDITYLKNFKNADR